MATTIFKNNVLVNCLAISLSLTKQLDGAFVLSKSRPGKKRQTQVDRGGIQSVNRRVQLDSKAIVGVEFPGDMNQYLGEVGIDAPISVFVGVGQGTASNVASYPHMV